MKLVWNMEYQYQILILKLGIYIFLFLLYLYLSAYLYFTIYIYSYDTTIPRQVGLSGSSAIITSLMYCLLNAYHVTNDDIPIEVLPTLILSVETKELNITAGLQDRVVQVYDNLVYMDFNKEYMDVTERGKYEVLNVELPQLFLAYINNPTEISFFLYDLIYFVFFF